jgi:hypothetical protein
MRSVVGAVIDDECAAFFDAKPREIWTFHV